MTPPKAAGIEEKTIDELVEGADFGARKERSADLPAASREFALGAEGAWTFRDGRNIPKDDLHRCFEMLSKEISAKYPVEVRCNNANTVRDDLRDIGVRWGAGKVREFLKDVVSKRHDQAFFEGDVHPVMLGIYGTATGKLIGCFQWAGIKRLRPPERVGDDTSHFYSALPVSGFVWMDRPRPKHRLTLDVISRFFNRPLARRPGHTYWIEEAHAPLYVDLTRGDEWDKTIETWEVELAAREAAGAVRVQTITDPEKPNRKYQVIRKG